MFGTEVQQQLRVKRRHHHPTALHASLPSHHARCTVLFTYNERNGNRATPDKTETPSVSISAFNVRLSTPPSHNTALRASVPAIGLRTLGISEIGEGGCSYCAGGGGGG